MNIETPSAVFERKPSNIVYLKHKEDWAEPYTLDTAKANLAALRSLIEGRQCGLVVYPPNIHLPKEVLEHYQEARAGQVATAFVINSFAKKIVANLFIKLASKRDIEPTKAFNNEDDATQWVLSILNQNA